MIHLVVYMMCLTLPFWGAAWLGQGKPTGVALVVGTWTTEDRHLAMGSVFQPHHETRQREAVMYLKQQGDQLSGYSITARHDAISNQGDWKEGRTTFNRVTFSEGKLMIEFNIKDVSHGWGRQVKSPGMMRIEAAVQGDRMIGKWGLFLPDGSEPFRGEFEAVRGIQPEKKK